MKCSYPKIVNDSYGRELKDLVTFMIQLNPKLRPSAATLVKVCKNKVSSKHPDKQEQTISFHLSNVVIPGMEATQLSE